MPKKGEILPLSPRQLRAATMIATGMMQKDIARELKVRDATISTWKTREDFRQAIEEAFGKVLFDTRNKALRLFARQMDDKDKWLAQNAAGRALAQYNSVYSREQSGNITFVFGNVESPLGMPISSNMDLVPAEASENPD